MIYAIPYMQDRVSNHFMKAEQFAFYNEDNDYISNIDNPAIANNSSCKDKKAAIELLSKMNTDAVIVRNIGERSLEKLLKNNVRVFQVRGRTPVSLAVKSPMIELTTLEQARPSENHRSKGGCSSHNHKHSHGDTCCSNQNHGEHKGAHRHSKRSFQQISAITALKPQNDG